MPQISPLDVTLPITPQVYDLLRQRIVTNVLPPGTLVSQPAIARECAVSRQPVREACIRLAEQGLVTVLPQRGTLVSRINYGAVLDARFLREAIEADIAGIVASRPEAEFVAGLRRQIRAQRAAARQADTDAFIGLDEQFHASLAMQAGTPTAWNLIVDLKAQMDRVRYLSLEQFPLSRLIDQHAAIVRQIETGSVAGAERAMRRHLRQLLADLPGIYTAHPDYFAVPAGGIPEPVNTPMRGEEV